MRQEWRSGCRGHPAKGCPCPAVCEPSHEDCEGIFFRTQAAGFIPAGRINAAIGTDAVATLINCSAQPVGDRISATATFRESPERGWVLSARTDSGSEDTSRGPPCPRCGAPGLHMIDGCRHCGACGFDEDCG
jgi:hypothetical protein